MKQQLAFLAEANSLVHQSACALRQAQPLLLLQASEALSQLIAKWRKAEAERLTRLRRPDLWTLYEKGKG